ncbi:hypothetical protein P6166_02405 [Stenotrophomonas sp. HITSZ_GD]|nr:hypothetical protein [Stenotrophomonas sp. HITSZ_GD]MDG2524209.1 hypothetical protein [Stenotrophomonas sp. HITSZ_GD]
MDKVSFAFCISGCVVMVAVGIARAIAPLRRLYESTYGGVHRG